MRTITSSANFSISAPDAYAYIFSPNVLTVTLGSGTWPANQLVYLIGNGITLSRRAIGHVVRFDLMPIFESKFANTDFNLATSTSDALYAVPFNCVVSVGGNITYVSFALRWGALQHDSTISYAAIRFPFWPNKPLTLNNSLEYTSWAHTIGGGNSGTDVLQLVVDTTVQFTYTVTNGASSQVTTFYPVSCPTDGHYLQWVDATGRIWQYMFNPSRMNGTTRTTSNDGSILRFPVDYTDSTKGRDLPVKKPKQRTFQCFASVDNDIYDIVASVVSSPIVFYHTAGRWVRVTIAPTSIQPDAGWMSDIEFTVELPRDYIQRL